MSFNWDELVGQPNEESIKCICLRCMDTFELAYNVMVRCPNCLGVRIPAPMVGFTHESIGNAQWVVRYDDLEHRTRPKKDDSSPG